MTTTAAPKKVIKLLEISPLDAAVQQRDGGAQDLAGAHPAADEWVPSRFNARTVVADGGLAVWNTYSGAINYFPPGDVGAVSALLKRHVRLAGPLHGLAAYLERRGYLVNAQADEYRRVQLAFGKKHYRSDVLELILLASEDCNFRCTYCYEDFSKGTMEPWVRAAIKQLVQREIGTLRRLWVGWFGGEPLYGYAAVDELTAFFHEIADEHHIAYGSHMTTNGYLLTLERFRTLLARGVKDYQITLDGGPDQHDCRRPARDGSRTFDRILQNLRAMRTEDADYSVSVRVNYDSLSYQRLDPLLAILERDFAGDTRFGLAFHPVSTLGGPNDDALSVCGASQIRDANRHLRSSAIDRGFSVETIKSAASVGTQVCYAARPYNFIIGADGTVMKCTVSLGTKDNNRIGRITEEGELQLDSDKMALWVEPAFERDAGCRSCYLLPPCQGMYCPLVRIEHDRAPCPAPKRDLRGELETVVATMGRSRPDHIEGR